MIQRKKIKSLESSYDRADQKTGNMGPNDDSSLGIPGENLGLKHMFILGSQHVHSMVICWYSVQW